MWRRSQFVLAACVVASVLGGCVGLHAPENATELFSREQSSKRGDSPPPDAKAGLFQANICPPPGTPGYIVPASLAKRQSPSNLMTMRYSTGDRFNLQVPGATEFSGDYIVNADGRVLLPFAEPVMAIGLTNEELGQRIERALLSARLFREEQFRVSVRPVLYNAINVTISGAVFL